MTDADLARYWDDSAEALAWRIRVVRHAAGQSQTTFGDAVGARKELVKAWERGSSQPNRGALRAMRETYGATSDFILLGDWESLRAGVWATLRIAAETLAKPGAPRRAGSRSRSPGDAEDT